MQVQESVDTLANINDTIKKINPLGLIDTYEYLKQAVNSARGKSKRTKLFSNPFEGMTKYDIYKDPLEKAEMDGVLHSIFSNEQLKCKLINELGPFKLANDIVATSYGFVVNDFNKKKVYIMDGKLVHDKHVQKSAQQLGILSTKLLLRSSPNVSQEPYGIAIRLDGKFLVARLSNLEIYSSSSCKYKGDLNFKQDHEKIDDNRYAHDVAVLADGRIVVSDERNSTLILISKDEIVLRVITLNIRPIRVCAMPNGHVAISNWRKGKVCVIDLESGREVMTFDIQMAVSVFYHDQTDCLLIGRHLSQNEDGYPLPGSGVIEQYCATSGKLIGRIVEGLYGPNGVAIMSVIKRVLIVADCLTVKVYNID